MTRIFVAREFASVKFAGFTVFHMEFVQQRRKVTHFAFLLVYCLRAMRNATFLRRFLCSDAYMFRFGDAVCEYVSGLTCLHPALQASIWQVVIGRFSLLREKSFSYCFCICLIGLITAATTVTFHALYQALNAHVIIVMRIECAYAYLLCQALSVGIGAWTHYQYPYGSRVSFVSDSYARCSFLLSNT